MNPSDILVTAMVAGDDTQIHGEAEISQQIVEVLQRYTARSANNEVTVGLG